MLDQAMGRLLAPALDYAGRRLANMGVSADALTFIGLAFGLSAGLCIAWGADGLALSLILGNRVLDGLDGAVSRATSQTYRGGFLTSF